MLIKYTKWLLIMGWVMTAQVALFAAGSNGRAQGTTYLNFSYLPLFGDKFFDNSGSAKAKDGPRYNKNALLHYGEYGLYDNDFTLIWSSEVMSHSIEGH